METGSHEQTLHSDHTTVAMASDASCNHDNRNSIALSENDGATLPHPTLTEDTYSTDLFRAFPKVCQKAKSGVQFCQAVSAFVTERAGLESNFAQALLKLAQGAKAEDWSQQFSKCWASFKEATEHLAHEQWAFAQTMETAIGPRAKAFAAQQETQVQRLVAEGTKVRWSRQQMISSMDKARDKYERKCHEAIEVTATMRKNETADVGVASSDVPDEVSMSKELTDKLAAGAGQLLTKMWDTTSAFGRNPLERQRSKLYGSLDDVIAAEKHYVQAVEYTNAQRLVVDREIKDNLLAFQLTEEQRLEYLRDVLMRMQKAFIDMCLRSLQCVERMKASVHEVHELCKQTQLLNILVDTLLADRLKMLADIEKGFQSLGSQEDVDVDRADLSVNPIYIRMTHIQAMSGNGQRMVGMINTVVTELIANETRYTQSLRKLLRTHESGGLTTDLFGASFNAVSFLANEGTTMANAWTTVKDQVKLLLEVHQEFRSLLAEPVSLSLATMKSEYERVRASTQEGFMKMHTALGNEAAVYKKLQQKVETRTRDFAMTFSYLAGARPVGTNSSVIDITEALKVLNANTQLFDERGRRSEDKLRQLADEIRVLQVQVADTSDSLKQTYQNYVQELEVFISTYMKNEKYRLQVSKNSLQSLAKAFEHMLQGGKAVGHMALNEFEKIDPINDMAEFIQTNRQPYEPTKLFVPAYHNNDSLKEAMKDYLGTATLAASENADKTFQNLSSGASPSVSTPNNETVSAEKKSTHGNESSDRVQKVAQAPEIAKDDPILVENEAAISEMDQELSEAQPLEISDFEKKFNLDAPDQVVESYSCALYFSNFPFHGRLYLTSNRICFSGWRDTIFVASLSEIAAMEKKTTALIVPNAIEFLVRGEKVFFASFVFRDECFQSIQQLRSIKNETEELMLDLAKDHHGTDGKFSIGNESRRRSSSDDLAAVAPTPPVTSTLPTPADASRSPPSSISLASAAPCVIPEKDTLLSEYDILLNEEVAFSVETVFTKFWIESNTFSRKILDAAGATDIDLPDWTKQSVSYTAVTESDTFDGSRLVTYTHNKKYMVGPSAIPTTQSQRYSYAKDSRLIVSTTTSVFDVPYCDYFRVEHRWIFSASKRPGMCLVQVGLRVQWLKTTWLKKQIESTTVSEAKDAVKAWLAAALDATKKQKLTGEAETCALKSTPLGQKNPSTVTRVQNVSLEPLTRKVATASSSPIAAARIPNDGLQSQLHPTIQAAIVVCALTLIYIMHHLYTAIDQLQALTSKSLDQQHQQQEMLLELLKRLENM